MQTLTAGVTGSKVATKGTRRHLRAAFRVALAGAVAVALVPERHTFIDGVRRLSRLSPAWLLVAVATEAISFLAAAELQRRLLAAVGVDIDRLPSLRLVSAAWSVSAVLPAGPAFSTAYTYRQLTRRGAASGPAVWVLAAGGVLSVGSLILLGVIGAELCRKALPALPAGVALNVGAGVVVAAAAVALVWSARHSSAVRRMADGLSDLFGSRLRSPFPPLAGLATWAATLALATTNWMADLAALGIAFVSLGVAVPWRGVLLAYVVGQLATSIPLLPGSVGVAEAAMALSLAAVGTPPAAAVAVVLVYRLISFWLPLPIGLWFWAGSRLRAPPGQETLPLSLFPSPCPIKRRRR